MATPPSSGSAIAAIARRRSPPTPSRWRPNTAVPTVALHTDKFDRVVASVTKMAGLPQAARAFVPQPVMGKTAAELKAYVHGKDPITGRPLMQEIVEALTGALDDARSGV